MLLFEFFTSFIVIRVIYIQKRTWILRFWIEIVNFIIILVVIIFRYKSSSTFSVFVFTEKIVIFTRRPIPLILVLPKNDNGTNEKVTFRCLFGPENDSEGVNLQIRKCYELAKIGNKKQKRRQKRRTGPPITIKD